VRLPPRPRPRKACNWGPAGAVVVAGRRCPGCWKDCLLPLGAACTTIVGAGGGIAFGGRRSSSAPTLSMDLKAVSHPYVLTMANIRSRLYTTDLTASGSKAQDAAMMSKESNSCVSLRVNLEDPLWSRT
jgi:hypothetical protein